MNNLTTTISFSIHSNKGIYALLVGSGISRPSGIPTGWDIVLDLIRKIAALNNEDCMPDPEKWFKEKYKEEPDYSNLLSKLVATPSERINLLKPYFEPTDDEREQGLKLPTAAHISIATLVKKGYIKLIITTNFDKLLENALQSVGIEPTIIRHASDIEGTMPLEHNSFTLIKINGDYLDSRFLNTKKELSKYETKMHNYLLQIINNYGIISCGWSAKWDSGLVNILKQCQNFRFGSYWAYKDICENELTEIANYRKGQIIGIKDADSFFSEIEQKIDALESINDNHPLNADIALARLKKFIVKEEYLILLHDLIMSEQESTSNKIKQFEDFTLYPDHGQLFPQFARYESSLEILLKLVINGVYWSKPEHRILFQNLISRISEPVPDPLGRVYQVSQDLHFYPSLLLVYALGISSIKAQKFEILTTCFQLKISERASENSEKLFLIQQTNAWLVDPKILNQIFSTNLKTPMSSHVNQILRPYFKELIINDQEYNDIFDIFEYMLGLNYLYLIGDKYGSDWAPYGQYKWRSFSGFRKNSLFFEFFNEAVILRASWLPIKSGMFGGDFDKYLELKTKLDKFLTGFHL
jgi:hypothetical protein